MFDDFEDTSARPHASQSAYIKITDVPDIPESISIQDYQMLIPKAFEEDIKAFIDGDTIVIRCLRSDNENYTDVLIKGTLFNSKQYETVLPKFLFEKSGFDVDYFNKDKDHILNVNQFLYLLIQHRLTFFKQYNSQFTYLLQKDINLLGDYIEYQLPVAFNSKQKALNTYAIIAESRHSITPAGNFLTNPYPNEEEWNNILINLSKYVHPSSDTAMHKRAKIILSPTPIYRGVGYKYNSDGSFYSLFETKQNISARLKTHLVGDAKLIQSPDMSCFQQDCIVDTSGDTPVLRAKDATMKKAIVVFAPIEWDSKRFLAGEAEVSANIADTLVVNTDSVDVSFTSKEGFRLKHDIGLKVSVSKGKEILLGYDDELEPVTLPRGVLSYKVTKIKQASSSGLSKLYFEAVMKAGNARITSSTGLKFVSKVMTNLGTICLPKRENTSQVTKFSPSVTQYLKDIDDSILAQYQRIEPSTLDVDVLEPDVIVGMNAVKANTNDQCNTIVLAQAALAVELGYFIPEAKFGFKNILNSLDVDEINKAAQSLPEFFYLDRFGQRQKVLIGLSHLNFTELGSVYSRFKPQSFAFTSGKNIHQNMPELSKHIYDNYREEDKVTIAKELYKVLHDPRGRLKTLDKIPRYTPAHIRKNKIFNSIDLILSKTSFTNGEESRLLDENWNKGFYISLAPKVNLSIRIPSAKTLKSFVGKLPDGSYSFSSIIVNISKMIQNITGTAANNYSMNLGYLYNFKKSLAKSGKLRMSTYDLYITSVQGALYSSAESSMMLIQTLIKPKINGIGMKQVVEPLLPDDVIVITDDYKYKRIVKESSSQDLVDIDALKNLLEEDYDYTIDTVLDSLFVDEQSSAEEVEKVLDDVPRVLAIRNPSYTINVLALRMNKHTSKHN